MMTTAGAFLGGLGLFLLAVSMITDGLKIATGNALRDILARSTGTRLRGVASGAALTAMVQSSSAVTVATIGFVNAGLLGVSQALGIVVGATFGTTMTAWLVAGLGFQFSISSFALPLVGVGMMVRLFGPSRRVGALGEALAGFGLFFIGIDFLRGGFESIALTIDVAGLSPEGVSGILLFVGIGIVMTVLTQSSSAAVAITLSAVGGGLVGFPAAAAIMIGAKIGTTSTSALAVIGATANAKRIAIGHVAINTFNALVGLVLLPLAIHLLEGTEALRLLPVIMLALYYSLFNLIGVVLLFRLIEPLANWLKARFVSTAETLGRPQFLDRNVLASPSLALDAFYLELARMAALARQHAKSALGTEQPDLDRRQRHDGLKSLVLEVEHFVAELEAERIRMDVAAQLPLVLRVANYIDDMVDEAEEITSERSGVEVLMVTSLRDDIMGYQQAVVALIDRGSCPPAEFMPDQAETEYNVLHERWRHVKTSLLNAGARKEVPISRLNTGIDSLRGMLWMAERATRVATRMKELFDAIPSPATAPEAPPTPDPVG